MKVDLRSLNQELRTRVEALGLPGVIGIGLLVFTTMMYAAHVAPLATEVAAEREEAQALSQKMGGRPAAAQHDPAARLGSFYTYFPEQHATPEWLAKFEAAAKENSLRLTSGEYKLERGNDRLMRYQIVFPVTGSYDQLRAFIGMVLQEIPAASLDEVSVRRENVGSGTLEARLRFTLFLRPTA